MDNRYSARSLSLRLGNRQIIHDVSLQLCGGEMTALIGPNGAGKSTLLRLLTGYLTPEEGQRVVEGRPIIAMGRSPWDGAINQEMICQVMKETGCDHLAGRRYPTLSGGEQQRVQLARCLAQLWRDGAPEGWLFLDEPTSALDLYYQQHLLRLLKRLTRSRRLHVCVVLHDLNLAALWADRILLLHQGKLVAQGTPQEVIQQPIISRWYGAEVSTGKHPDAAVPQVYLAP